ncbi:Uma2 family endonuclease [Arcicella sp. LKC2W]|uniref:Uma2 family endonuclease n=1 Tax=Arcicella sp. LKC2W TaxID=2984198 RepID=UPI002B2200FD|nr:Uma2 family endonuclease [Arcicella sp. LKC2W]MEA5460209.1 Uma2 family endonuclease [Arcicella sp. LKC2W]
MVKIQDNIIQFPKTLEAFLDWQQPNDGVKYEWYNDELVQFEGMKKKQYYIFDILNILFIEKGYHRKGTLMAEPDVMLTQFQMRRPDIAYFSREQIYQGREGIDVIPTFAIEVISPNDHLIDVEAKLIEYFKADVKVVWHIIPEQEVVYVYTSRKDVKICFDDDICSAKPVLEDFEISVADIFKDYKVSE